MEQPGIVSQTLANPSTGLAPTGVAPSRAARLFADARAWAAAERGRLVLWLPVAMMAGVLLYFALAAEPPVWAGPSVLLPAMLGAVLLRRLFLPRAALLAVVAASAGFTSVSVAAYRAPPIAPLPRHAMMLSGTVRAVEALPAGRRVLLEAVSINDGTPFARTLRIRLRANDAAPVATGDRITVRAMARIPSPPSYPGGWDLQRDDYFSGLGGYGFALGPVSIVVHTSPHGFARAVQWVRETISLRVIAVLPGTEGAIASTLLTGGQAAIPPADRESFRASGLAHLLAVAGLHIGIVMGLVLGAARAVLAQSERAALHFPCKQIAAVAALLVGGVYMAMTGMHLPILRSFVMASLVTLGVLAGRRAVSLRGLALAAIVLMLIEPWEVVGVSFQMSFSAVLALIAGYEALRPHLHRLYGLGQRHRRFLLHVVGLALTSLLAGTASAPFAAYHFGRFQLYFVVANIVAVPLTAMWVMPLGLIAVALMPLRLEWLALAPMGWGIDAIVWIARHVEALPASVLAVPHIPVWGLLVASFGIAWIGLTRGRPRLLGVPVLTAGLLSALLVRPPDILVSDDARLVALRTPSGVFIAARGSPSSFTLDAWQQYWASDAPNDLPASADCDPDNACLLRAHDGRAAALLLIGDARPESCAGAAVIIATEPLRGRCRATSTAPYVDRFTVWRTGAQAIWLNTDGHADILADHTVRGDRPWVPDPRLRAD